MVLNAGFYQGIYSHTLGLDAFTAALCMRTNIPIFIRRAVVQGVRNLKQQASQVTSYICLGLFVVPRTGTFTTPREL